MEDRNMIISELLTIGVVKYFDVGNARFKVVRTSSGYYQLTVKDAGGEVDYMFSNIAECLAEIVSYSEIDADDYTPDF